MQVEFFKNGGLDPQHEVLSWISSGCKQQVIIHVISCSAQGRKLHVDIEVLDLQVPNQPEPPCFGLVFTLSLSTLSLNGPFGYFLHANAPTLANHPWNLPCSADVGHLQSGDSMSSPHRGSGAPARIIREDASTARLPGKSEAAGCEAHVK